MDGETTTITATPGDGAAPMPHGYPPLAIRAPSPARAKATVLGVEIGPEIASDGTLPLRCAADAIATARATWEAACELHAQELAKVSPVVTEAAALLRSRSWFYGAKQRTLKQADAALAEIRTEVKEI